MPTYISSHTMACMTRQMLDQLVKGLTSESTAEIRFIRMRGNLVEGKLVGEFEAPSRDELVAWLGRQKVHFDFLIRVEVEFTGPSPGD
jgi:hypothetical protein